MKPANYFQNPTYFPTPKSTFYKSLQQRSKSPHNPSPSPSPSNLTPIPSYSKTQPQPQKTQISASKNNKKIYDSFMYKIMNQLFQSESSSIQKEVPLDAYTREKIMEDFVERQEFLGRESKILKKMEEFCRFGAIREGFN